MVAGLPEEAIEHMICGNTVQQLATAYYKEYGVSNFNANPTLVVDNFKIAYESAIKRVDLDDIIIILDKLIKEVPDELS